MGYNGLPKETGCGENGVPMAASFCLRHLTGLGTLPAVQSQRDCQQQKGHLQEVGAAGHSVIVYPKSLRELNFIERFWGPAKH
jgi:Leu/Phe-tRNA-protein transferase